MLVPSENRERAAMFDLAVTTAHEALTHPEVAAQLGNLVTDLEIINKTAFLPDYHHGAFHIPPSYRHEPSVAIIPLADQVFDNEDLHMLVQPIFNEPIRTWPFHTAFMSERYGLDLTHEAQALLAEYGKPVDLLFTKDDDSTTMEAFTWQENICLMGERLCVTSRPVVLLRQSTLRQEDPIAVASIVVHEESHAVDLLIDGPMSGMVKFAVAGELRANYADYTILDRFNRPLPEEIVSIENLRQAENAGASNPFRPTDRIVGLMLQNNVI